MNTKIEFRLLAAADLSSYRKIRLDCLTLYPDNFGTSYIEEVNAVALKFEKALKQASSPDFLVGAFGAEGLIGICGFTREKRAKTMHRGEISQLFVQPDFSGQGIGTRLLKLTIERAFSDSTIEQIILGVVETNKTAVRLYGRLGFIEYGRLDNYLKADKQYWAELFMLLTKQNYLTTHSM